MKTKEQGLSGVTTAISTLANSKVAEKAVEKGFSTTGTIVKVVVGTLIVGGAIVFGPRMYKKWRRKSYARKNIENPDVQAAIIIRKAFTKLEFPPVLNWVFNDVILWTKEEELFKIARKVTSLKEVSKAYSILFDATLVEDLNSGFSSDEFKKFFEIVQGKEGNPDPNRVIHNGADVYWAMKSDGDILEAQYRSDQKKWIWFNKVWKRVKYNEKIGKVVQTSKRGNSRFYIVENTWDTRGFSNFSGQGVVWENQIKDRLD